MKKTLLSTVALLGLTAGAMAADLPMRAAPPPPIAAIPVFTWTGFYVGVNGGFAFNTEDNNGGGRRNGGRNNNTDGSGLGGGQVGYNMQFGTFVVGLEADAQAIAFDDVFGGRAILTRNGTLRFNNSGDVDVFGTVRGRAGFAFDRALIYVTGGLAWKAEDDNNNRNNGFGRGFNSNDDDFGWTVGGGVEYAFTNNFSAKIEGLFVSFDDGNNNNRRFNGVNFRNNRNEEFALVRAGINYRFGTW